MRLFNSLCNAHPRVFNIRSQQLGFDTLFTWQLEPYTAGAGYRFLIGINGELVGITKENQRSFSYPTPDFVSSLDILAIPASVRKLPSLYGDVYGRSVYLNWERSTAADLNRYIVRGYNSDSELIVTDEVKGSKLEATMFVLPDSGTGVGRVSIYGQYSGLKVNKQFSVKIGAGGFSHNMSGSFSTPKVFDKGSIFVLSDGVAVRFEDPRADYATDDLFYFNVGPLSYYSYKGELADGSYTWEVLAEDNAGNQSSALSKEIVIAGLPPAPTGVELTRYDADTLKFVKTADDYRWNIYTNWNRTLNVLEEDVIEERAFLFADGNDSYHFDYTVDGVYKFYVRGYDGETGLESDNTDMLVFDTRALPQNIYLNAPSNVTVTPLSDGRFRIAWDYPVKRGTDLAEFHLYVNTSSSSPVFSSFTTISGTADSAAPIKSFSYETGSYGGTRYFTVRAATTGGTYETKNTELTTGVPDADPPTLAGDLEGVPN